MPEIKKILCPIDFSECSERALDYAARMANTLNAELQLLHAYVDPLSAIPFARPGSAGPATAEPEIIAQARKKRQEEVRRLQDMCAQHGITVQVQEIEGEPRRVINEVANRENSDLIIMGTHGRTGAARALLGSVSERVVRSAPCPVLVVP